MAHEAKPSPKCSFAFENSPGFPLLNDLLYRFEKKYSLTRAAGSNPEYCRALALADIYSLTLVYWRDFLRVVNTWYSMSNVALVSQAFANDAHLILGSDSTLRRLSKAQNYLVETIIGHVKHKLRRSTTRGKFATEMLNLIAKESRMEIELSQDYLTDIKSRHNDRFTASSAHSTSAGAASTERLTLVASIFLPLTLASSLLAMSTRASSLGLLWYDFFGICITLGFIVLMLYQVFRKWDNWRRSTAIYEHYFALDRFFSWKHAYPWPNGRIIFRMTAVALAGLVVASFLAGMSNRLPLALTLLKYGIAACAAFTVCAWAGYIISIFLTIVKESGLAAICKLVWRTMRWEFHKVGLTRRVEAGEITEDEMQEIRRRYFAPPRLDRDRRSGVTSPTEPESYS